MRAWPLRAGSARILGVALFALTVFQARAESDKVTVVQGQRKEIVSGKITKDDRDGLEIEVVDPRAGNAKRSFPPSEILDVEYDIGAEGFRDAASAYRANAFSRAADGLKDFVDSKESMDQIRAVARPYVLYLYAESKYRSGAPMEAIAAYQKLIDTYKNSRYVPMALMNMADSSIRSGAFDKLPPLLAQLREGGADQKQMADYYEGQALMAQNKPAEALKKYSNAVTGPAVRVKAMALIGQARCLMLTGDSGKARDAAQSALNLAPSESLAAQAHTLVGDAILADADAKKLDGTPLQDALLDAILEYMRVQSQYTADTATEGYAMLKAGECFMRLCKMPSRSAFDDRGRAVSLFGRLTSERKFAGDLANKAFKHLEDMK